MKLVGLLLVFLGCTLGGYHFVKREGQRIHRMESLLDLVRELRRSISFLRLPLEEIYKRFFAESLKDTTFPDVLRKRGLYVAYEENQDLFGFDGFTQSRLMSFAASLGKHPAEEEIRSCDEIEALLSDVIDRAKREYPTKQRLYAALGISLGIGAVILLI